MSYENPEMGKIIYIKDWQKRHQSKEVIPTFRVTPIRPDISLENLETASKRSRTLSLFKKVITPLSTGILVANAAALILEGNSLVHQNIFPVFCGSVAVAGALAYINAHITINDYEAFLKDNANTD